MEVKGKKISIIGAVRSGIAAAKVVRHLGGIPFVSDMGYKEALGDSIKRLKELGIDYEVEAHSERIFDCDVMIVSPGVPMDAAIMKVAKEKKMNIISEIEFAYSVCKGNVLAITGTNGKTTTTSLLGHVIDTAGLHGYTAGNIGRAFSDVVLSVAEDDFVSLEVSSFQLDLIDQFKPSVAMILNITPDHLNRYDNNYERYIQSKFRIFKNQDEADLLILNADDTTLRNHEVKTNAQIQYFSLSVEQDNGAYLSDAEIIYKKAGTVEFKCKTSDISIKGEHNWSNAMAVIIAAKHIGVNNSALMSALKSFPGVEHRLEPVQGPNGVLYINDSKATNVDAVWYALRSFEKPLYLILGGLDKGNDYDQIRGLVEKNVKKIYAIGSSAKKIEYYFKEIVDVEIMESMEACVEKAHKEATSNEIVLLSPACASFDMYKSYEQRGKVFKEAVANLSK